MGFGAFGEQMFTKASQNSDISASCSENIVTVAFYVNVKSCRYFINRLALYLGTLGRHRLTRRQAAERGVFHLVNKPFRI
jgi:hypothetical protein